MVEHRGSLIVTGTTKDGMLSILSADMFVNRWIDSNRDPADERLDLNVIAGY